MSNRIDFFQSQQNRLAIPAALVAVFIDGSPCPDLEMIEIVRDRRPEFSRARLRYNPPVGAVESRFATGSSICIRQYYNGTPPGAAVFSLPIFAGQIESIETSLASDVQTIEITATDFSANLKLISVFGQRLTAFDGSTILLDGLDTIFNPAGKPNASVTPIQFMDKSCTVFNQDPAQSRLWTYAEAMNYLLCEYVQSGSLNTPSLAQLKALTENKIVHDLDVTGLNLLEALHRLCEEIGLEFKFVPRQATTGPEQAIVFSKAGTGRTIELNCQPAGQQLSISKTNIASLHSIKNRHPVTHRYTGYGDFKIYEAAFELIKAWDPALEDTDYDKFSASTNPDFDLVRDVYRKWCLNEDGRYSAAPYNQGGAFDFSKIFQSSSFARRPRRFQPALTKDAHEESLGYFLQVSLDYGQTWSQYLHSFSILPDQCGVWLSSDQLDNSIWLAAQDGSLKFRITASVVSDERLTATVANGPVNSTSPVVEHVIALPQRFKYSKVTDQSNFASGNKPQVDDSAALQEFIRRTAAMSQETIETIDIRTPSLMFDCQVGDIVGTSPKSRDLLATRSDRRSISRITRVQMDFENQCTNLRIARQRTFA